MDGPGHEFLACSAFTQNQNISGCVRDFSDGCIDLDHVSAVADHPPEARGFCHLLQKQGIFLFDPFCG